MAKIMKSDGHRKIKGPTNPKDFKIFIGHWFRMNPGNNTVVIWLDHEGEGYLEMSHEEAMELSKRLVSLSKAAQARAVLREDVGEINIV